MEIYRYAYDPIDIVRHVCWHMYLYQQIVKYSSCIMYLKIKPVLILYIDAALSRRENDIILISVHELQVVIYMTLCD